MSVSAKLPLLGSCLLLSSLAASAQTSYNFTCAAPKKSAIKLTKDSIYQGVQLTTAPTYGFDLSSAPTNFSSSSCTGEKPFFFSVSVPDGNYQVTIELGGDAASETTVRAESRRLMVREQKVAAGKSQKEIFNVAVRTASIAPRDKATADMAPKKVKLKPREIGALDWDDKLTLEFNGDHPSFRSIKIKSIETIPTIYLAGDSTVVDQDKEPWAAWGQMLPAFFTPKVTIANHAESGETIRSFVGENRYDKVMSTIRKGDYLMIQFAHNDQKPGSGYVPAMTDYTDLLRRYINDARSHGASAILVTSMMRRKFDASGKIVQTLGDYPEAMRQVAAEQHIPLIDLNEMSKTLFEAMGEQGTLKAFVHYPANTFPDQPEALADDTHFNSYGAYELARCIVQSIHDQHLKIAKYLKKNIPTFDPAHPEPVESWTVPASPIVSTATPYGR